MKIRFTNPNSTKYGREEHVENTIGKTLIALGEAEVVPYKDFRERLRSENPTAFAPVAAATVQWVVAKSAISERFFISGKCSQQQCSTVAYDAPPSSVIDSITFIHSCGCGQPEKIPAAVAAQYRKLFKPAATLSKDEAAYFNCARPDKTDGKHVDESTYRYPIYGMPREGNEKEGLLNYAPNPGDGKPLDPQFYKWK